MGKKSKRKNNKRHLCPPLTLLDKTIYSFCIVLSILCAFVLIVCSDHIRSAIAFNKAGTVAYVSNVSSLFSAPFVLYLLISALVFFASAWESKKPILGNKRYKYGEYPYKQDCIPLFPRKKYKLNKRPSQKRFTRQMIALWCLFLFFTACLIPFSLFGRNALYEDNRIERITPVNLTRDTYTTDDFDHLTIRAYRNTNPRTYNITGRWTYAITIETKDGNEFIFSYSDFNRDVAFDKMLEIKSLFDTESITITGDENTGKVAEDLALDKTQQIKLNQLFTRQTD